MKKKHERNVVIVLACSVVLFLWLIEAAHGATVQTSVEVAIVGEVSSKVRCTNANWEHSLYCTAPVDVNTLELTESGYNGMLTTGVYFEQKRIFAHLQKFTMEDVYWYIDKHGKFDADNDFHALSIYLSRLLTM